MKIGLRTAVCAGACLAGLGSNAAAQGNVTVFGLIDTGLEYINHVDAAGNDKVRATPLTGLLPSRIGFRGSEDLGGGLRAFFVLETGLVPTTGALGQGNRMFGRQANVGLADARLGTLTLGRQYNMTAYSLLGADIMGPANHGLSNMDGYIPNTRSDNAVGYMHTVDGVTAGATYSLGRDASSAGGPAATSCAGERAGDAQACRQWTAMVKYDSQRWGVATAYDLLRGGPGAAYGLTDNGYKDKRTSFNGWFKAGNLKVGGGLIARQLRREIAMDNKLWYLGASYPLSPALQLEAQLAHLDTEDSPDDSTLATARLIHALSKRTSVYASYAHIQNKGKAAIAVSAGSSVGVGMRQSSVMAGIRHLF